MSIQRIDPVATIPMVHRRKHNEHFLTLIDHGTVPRCERMPRVLGALTVSYNSSVNWLERCFDYHYDCDSYAWNVFNSVSYITYLLAPRIFFPFLSKDHLPILRKNENTTILLNVPSILLHHSIQSVISRQRCISLVLCPRRTINNSILDTWSLIQPFYYLL